MTRKKPVYNNDPFDIDKKTNFISKNRRNAEVVSNTDYSTGEKSPYREWTGALDEFDPINPDLIGEGQQPWDRLPISEENEELFQALQALYPKLKGRQREVMNALLSGETNQSAIARRIGIDQREVATHIRRIAKKVKQSCM